jgi:hypothetical protein
VLVQTVARPLTQLYTTVPAAAVRLKRKPKVNRISHHMRRMLSFIFSYRYLISVSRCEIKFIRHLALCVSRQRSETDRPLRLPGKNWTRGFEKRQPETQARRVKAPD